jgi:hypothetical protein
MLMDNYVEALMSKVSIPFMKNYPNLRALSMV